MQGGGIGHLGDNRDFLCSQIGKTGLYPRRGRGLQYDALGATPRNGPQKGDDVALFHRFCEMETGAKVAGRVRGSSATDPVRGQALMKKWAQVCAQGAGIIVVRQGVPDHAVIDRASAIFDQIIAAEKQAVKGGATILPSRARMIASGTRGKSTVWPIRPTLPPISAQIASQWRRRPNLGQAIR